MRDKIEGFLLGLALIGVMTGLSLLGHHHQAPVPPVHPVVHHFTPSPPPYQAPVEAPEESTDQVPSSVLPPSTVIGLGTGGMGVLA